VRGVLNGAALSCLTVRNDLSELARVSSWVHVWAGQLGLPAPTAMRLDLCSTEIVTNIVTHGDRNHSAHEIVLRLDRCGSDLALEIQDDGPAFDPRLVEELQPPTSLEEARVGGWGIALVRHFSDGLRYHRSEGRNCLTLIFHAPS
jgi:serine/threonine-protein kinase RsbW